MKYNPQFIEDKWQKIWDQQQTYRTESTSDKPKYYVLDMFPYPSGKGLHVGHPKGYVGSDIVARYKRMKGFHVLHPMGWDSFGLPAERQATKEGVQPAKLTERNIKTFRKQLKSLGLSFDWSREISTSTPEYYQWTQWIFLELYKKGLAYQAEVPVNWCPALGTVLANEEVKEGVYIETGDPVEKKNMRQWMLKITDYAQRLIDDLDLVDWPESLKTMQRNWIGRSEGALVKFKLVNDHGSFEVFTTRPDTLFGCTFCILAPEHRLIKQITTPAQQQAVSDYLREVDKKSERDRTTQVQNKTGVFTGAFAICPINQEKVPIWISDFVLATHGTGAIFACPAHDERDHQFAQKFDLPIVEVVAGGNVEKEAYTADGVHVNSDFLNGLQIKEAKAKALDWLEEKQLGKRHVTYHLRDWLFSRQRYWGEPLPIVLDDENQTYPVSENDLPIPLPPLEDLSVSESGESPLTRAKEWVNQVPKVQGKTVRRETNTMPQWAGSCWYYLRFVDPHNVEKAWDADIEKYWLPVDLYVGGTEHATLHLLYARFWHKVLYDLGHVSTPEPFQKLFNQGMILARSFRDDQGKYYYPSEVEKKGETWVVQGTETVLQTRLEKMSKSKYNIVTPEEIVESYGADSLRIYEVFMAPLEDEAVWQTEGVVGVRRFLERSWSLLEMKDDQLALDASKELEDLERTLHKTIKKASEDIEKLKMNTTISQMMIFMNEAKKLKRIPTSIVECYFRLLSPFAPHLAEEAWSLLGHTSSIVYAEWPSYDEQKVTDDVVNFAIQVNGKLRSNLSLPIDSSQEEVQEKALVIEKVHQHVKDKEIIKVVFVPKRLINIVVK